MKVIAFIASMITGAILLYGVQEFAPWADPTSPANTHLSSYFIKNVVPETHVPNLVTAILGDYRGYDTMFETVVIFCAGMAVICVLRGSKS